tara:strand:- start:160 stop:348 length:189 start_codon:yes stop_codon:yes gene_type:complete
MKDQENQTSVERREIKNMVELYNKFKQNKLEVEDKVVMDKSVIGETREDLPVELRVSIESFN